jgi:hypothetical protein
MRGKMYPGEFILFSAIAGSFCALLKTFIHQAFVWLGVSQNFYAMVVAFFTHGHLELENFAEKAFAQLGDMVIGGLLGIVLAIWLKMSRSRYHWWIALGYGTGIWFSSLSFGNLAKIIQEEMTTPWELFAHLMAMVTYALLFLFVSRLWRPLRERLEVAELEEDYAEDHFGDDEQKENGIKIKKSIKI